MNAPAVCPSGNPFTLQFKDENGNNVKVKVTPSACDDHDIDDHSSNNNNNSMMDGMPKWLQMMMKMFMGGDMDMSNNNNNHSHNHNHNNTTTSNNNNNNNNNTTTSNNNNPTTTTTTPNGVDPKVENYYKSMSDKDASRTVWDMIPDGKTMNKQELLEKMEDPKTSAYQKAAIQKFTESKDGKQSMFDQADNQGNYWYHGHLNYGSGDGSIGRGDLEHKWHVGNYTAAGDYPE